MSSIAGYITYPQKTDPQDLMQEAFAYLQAKIPGWQPAEGNLDTWIIEAFSSEAADIQTLATQVPKTIFRYLGAKLFQVEPVDAVAATCTALVSSIDTNGHTIPAGTQCSIMDANGNAISFVTLADAVILNGDSTVTVTLVAVTPSASANGAGGISTPVTLVDSLAWVLSIVQSTAVAGGVDAESDDDYLNRLSYDLQTIAPRPILPGDFSILSRNVAGIQRSVTIDGYNPDDSSFDNERMVCVFSIDIDGQPVSGGVKTADSTYLTSLREINFIVNTADPVLVRTSVACQVSVLPSYDPTDVATRVTAAIAGFINPAAWGISAFDNPNDPITWVNKTTLSYIALGSLIQTVSGVDTVLTLTVGPHGGTLAAHDFDMSGDGVVTLPYTGSGDITVTTA